MSRTDKTSLSQERWLPPKDSFLFNKLFNNSSVGQICDLPDIRNGKQDWIQDKGNDHPAESLNQVGRNTCSCGGYSIEGNFAEKISSGYDNYIGDSTEYYGYILALGSFAEFVVD